MGMHECTMNEYCQQKNEFENIYLYTYVRSHQDMLNVKCSLYVRRPTDI